MAKSLFILLANKYKSRSNLRTIFPKIKIYRKRYVDFNSERESLTNNFAIRNNWFAGIFFPNLDWLPFHLHPPTLLSFEFLNFLYLELIETG